MQPSTPFHHNAASPVTHSLTDPLTTSTASSHSPPSINNNNNNIDIISGVNPSNMMQPTNNFDVNASLMSPPEAVPLDSFTRPSPTKSMAMGPRMKSLFPAPGGSFPMSPPVSPATQNITTAEAPALVVRDPILYPTIEQQSSPSSQSPLFTEDEALVAQRLVDGHVAARESSFFREASPPRKSEYELVLEFKAEVAKQFNANRNKWLNRERLYLLEDRALQSGTRRYTNIAPATGPPRPRPAVKPVRNGGVVKPRATKPPAIRATPDRANGPKVAREDKDFNALPDYCPPVTSLPSKPNSLKVDWRGAPIDLRNDPNASLLHPDELLLAANLRLDCATYLTSKRRIFIKRIEALRIGKEFRKTDAQQACKIDVNKASKLWQAFEKVGWLQPSWVRNYV